MPAVESTDNELRVLILAPTGGDARNAQAVLTQAGLDSFCCKDLEELCLAIPVGASALLLAEEALTKSGVPALLEILNRPEPWSDLPLVIISGSGRSRLSAAREVFGEQINFTLLERPLNPYTLVAAMRSAVRARQKQYEIRRLLGERERLLEGEKNAKEEALAATRMKDLFLATVSHELRNPLNSILGFSQILRRGTKSPEETRKGLEIIERNARAQAALIDDLLDISRIVSGNLRLDMIEIEMSQVVLSAIDSVRPLAEAKGLKIVHRLVDTPCLIRADSVRLQQVVSNLLTNAIKFSSKGGTIDVRLNVQDSLAILTVRDEGVGISREFLPFVFDRFRQEAKKINRSAMGLGLGLSIVRHLMEMHGGTIEAHSQGEGKGATFTARLPIVHVEMRDLQDDLSEPLTPSDDQATVNLVSLRGMKILAVDDEPDARTLLKDLLEECGATVKTAGSAQEAIDLFRTFHPEVLLSDLGMPEEDGFALIRKIRDFRREEGGNIPAVAITAFATPDDRLRSLNAGFHAHLSKPVSASKLAATIADLTRSAE